MGTDYTAGSVSSGVAQRTTWNAQLAAIQTALERMLNIYGDSTNGANAMQTTLDMNGNKVLNVPAPTLTTDLVRLGDLSVADAATALTTTIVDAANKYASDNVEGALAEILTLIEAASTANGEGASLLGIEDAAGNFTAATVEAALAEIFTKFASNTATEGSDLVGATKEYNAEFVQTISDIKNGTRVGILRFINPALHSAIKDGTSATEVHAAIQDGLDAMEANGKGSLDFTYGRFLLGATLNVEGNDLGLFGAGMGGTIFDRVDGTFGDMFLIARPTPAVNQLRGFTMKDLTLYAGVDVDSGASLHFQNVTRVITDSVFLRNYHIGIHTEGVRDSHFNNIQGMSNEFHTTTRTTSRHIKIDDAADSTKVSTETSFSNFNFTTADPNDDIQNGIEIKECDGIWWSNGHIFGGKNAGLLINGQGTDNLSGVTFDQVWFDQYTPTNVQITGVATTPTKFRLLTFNNCRMWGGSSLNMDLAASCNIEDVNLKGCEIGVTNGNGISLNAGGTVKLLNCDLKRINIDDTAGGYALNVPSASTLDKLIISGGTIERDNLTTVLDLDDTGTTYLINGISISGDDTSIGSEITFGGTTLVGSILNINSDRAASSDVAAAGNVTFDLAVDTINLTGGATTVNNIYPRIHGKKITLKADASTQTISASAGNIKTKDGANISLTVDKSRTFVFFSDSNRWYEQ